MTSAPPNKLLLAAAAMHGFLSLGHTAKGRTMFKDPAFARLPAILTSTVKAGWFEGSVCFAIFSLLNYRWAHAGLSDSLDAGIASLISVLCFGAGGYYAKSGDNGGGVLLVVAGALQGWAGRSGL